ncbi:MAG: hypothetical protein A2919_00350 [Candidatus Spechtbacteria bacterium RIFCSPLOWO2_01_FULL_43_12]|uniref:Uncharacterized protein n=1 Tax=Candidatus Spechtbacteria bacterium RIFCSPLOWO2_01_FULL_43_12 TaxID=1802162 RepID=A0A1G2HFD2_9BACT|nr:MAG: hypothetical protein A2919_00350 [Candidatus Spechtbacteria bacterium RIFCSPLOWO2_01_FULL_43_12]
MISGIFNKVAKFFTEFATRFPLLFAKNSQKIFWAGMVLVLLAGGLIFYSKTYLPMNTEYEVFVTVRRVNQGLLDKIFQYVMDRRDVNGPFPTENPFEP